MDINRIIITFFHNLFIFHVWMFIILKEISTFLLSNIHKIAAHIHTISNKNMNNMVNMSMFCIGHTRLTHKHFMSRNDQHPTCSNATCRKRTMTLKHSLEECPQSVH